MRVGLRLLAGVAIWCVSTGAWACVEHKTQVRGKGTQIQVPGVVGDSERLAIECLRRYGYTPKLGGVIPSKQPEGTVALTVPAEGAAPIPEGQRGRVTVTYWVSSGAVAYERNVSDEAPFEEVSPRQERSQEGAEAAAQVASPAPVSPPPSSQTSGRTVVVPDLRGRPLSSAKTRLKFNRLHPGDIAWHARGGKPGRVVTQVPAAGTRVPIRTRVDLVVSNGQLGAFVPDVVGDEELDAINALASARLKAIRQGPVNSSLRAGTVVRTDPVAGSEVPSGAVAYWVASGRNVVPNLRGRTREDAAKALRTAGFAVSNGPLRFDDGKPDRVVEQKPAAGAVAAVGTRVVLSLGKPRTVPKVVGLSEGDARKALAAAGLKGVRSGAGDVSQPGGRVTASEPRAGTRIRKGATVRYQLAQPVASAAIADAGQGAPPAGAPSGATPEELAASVPQPPASIAALPSEVTSNSKMDPGFRRDDGRGDDRGDDRGDGSDDANIASNDPSPIDDNPAPVRDEAPSDEIALNRGDEAAASIDAPPNRESPAPARDAPPPASEQPSPVGNTGTAAQPKETNLLQDTLAFAQSAWKVIAGSTTLALLLASIWWTQLRTWPWNWPPPRPRMGVKLKPAEAPWPMMSPLDHDPTLDVRIRAAVAAGETSFEKPLPVRDTETRHD